MDMYRCVNLPRGLCSFVQNHKDIPNAERHRHIHFGAVAHTHAG